MPYNPLFNVFLIAVKMYKVELSGAQRREWPFRPGYPQPGSFLLPASQRPSIRRKGDIARQFVTRFGMAKELGQAVFERQS